MNTPNQSELVKLRELLREATQGGNQLSGMACEHGWDRNVCLIKGCGPDPEEARDALIEALPGLLDRIAELEAALAQSERETQAVWRCAIGDAVTAMDGLKNEWINSRRKAEREAGARLAGHLDNIWPSRWPAPKNYKEANANGRAMIDRARASLTMKGQS